MKVEAPEPLELDPDSIEIEPDEPETLPPVRRETEPESKPESPLTISIDPVEATLLDDSIDTPPLWRSLAPPEILTDPPRCVRPTPERRLISPPTSPEPERRSIAPPVALPTPTDIMILPADDSAELPVEISTDPLELEPEDAVFKETDPLSPKALIPLEISTTPLEPSLEAPPLSRNEPPTPDPNNEDPAVTEIAPPLPAALDAPPSNERVPTSAALELSETEISTEPLRPAEPLPLRIDTSPPDDPEPPKRETEPPRPLTARFSPPRSETSAPLPLVRLDPPKTVISPATPKALSPDMILTPPLL